MRANCYYLFKLIVCVNESWLNPSIFIFNHEILSNNFTIFRRDRNSRGGGILVAVNNRFQSRLISTHEYIEQINVEMITRGSPDKYLQNVLKAGSLDTSKPTLLLGDFNCPDIDWSASHFVIRLNLVQLVTQYLGHNSNHNVPHQFDICFQRIL